MGRGGGTRPTWSRHATSDLVIFEHRRRKYVGATDAGLAARYRVAGKLDAEALRTLRRPPSQEAAWSQMRMLAEAGILACPGSGIPVFDPTNAPPSLWAFFISLAEALNTPSEEASKWLRVPLRPLPHTFSTPPIFVRPAKLCGSADSKNVLLHFQELTISQCSRGRFPAPSNQASTHAADANVSTQMCRRSRSNDALVQTTSAALLLALVSRSVLRLATPARAWRAHAVLRMQCSAHAVYAL